MANGTLVRDVVERHNTPSSASRQPIPSGGGSSSKTGFPPVQHRSKATSAFKRARLDQLVQKDLDVSRKIFPHSSSRADDMEGKTVVEDSMVDISRSNAEAVGRMTEEERQRERQDILDQLGPGVDELMIKVREARARRADSQATDEISSSEPLKVLSSATKDSDGSLPLSPPLPSARRIRFLDPTDADIHVYESQPSSPRRTLGLLPPPSEAQDKSGISSLGTFKGSMREGNPSGHVLPKSSIQAVTDTPEEGTPEDIRRRYFPLELPAEDNPALTWMLPSVASSSNAIPPENSDEDDFVDASSIDPRYSLSGVRLSPSQIRNLPTHLGLHHHASSSLDTPAGYTLSELLLLSRSSVPAQRASILGVLAKVLRISREESDGGHNDNSEIHSSQQVVDVDAMRRDVLDAAIDALGEKGGVGQRAVDLLWEAVVGFAYTDFDITDLSALPCVDLTPISPSKSSSASKSSIANERISTKFSRHSSAILVALPLTRILPALKSHLAISQLPFTLTHSRVLDVLLVLSHFSQHARMIVNSDAGVISAMLGVHLQPLESDSDPDEHQLRVAATSIRVLQVLARCGRDVAVTLTGPADVLLRYVMTPLPPLDLAQWQSNAPAPSLEFLTETLVFYTLLAQYGVYTHVATMAQNEFAQIGSWLLTIFRVVSDSTIVCLACAYLRFLEALIVCATNPHTTSPSHDILWSQVRGWGWIEWTLDFTDVVAVAASEPGVSPSYAGRNVCYEQERHLLWTRLFHTIASWVEGASVNGIKHGEEERTLVSTRIRPSFDTGCVAELAVLDAIARLQTWKFPSSLTTPSLATLRDLADAAGLLAAATRLSLACFPSGGEWSWKLPAHDIHDVCMRLLRHEATRGLFTFIVGYHDTTNIPEDAHTFVRAVSSLLTLELQLCHSSIILSANNLSVNRAISRREWVTHALLVLHTLLPGDEHYAQWIFERLCNDIDSNFVEEILSEIHLNERWNKGGMRTLLPFLTRSLRPKVATGEDDHVWCEAPYIAPISPTPESIAHCTTLSIPSLSYLRDSWILHDQDLALPIRSEWPTWPLNHLLRSGSSPVFHELPLDWDATETEVVQASLSLARMIQVLYDGRISYFSLSVAMSRAESIFACMKVFMLEHEQQQLDSGEEVFRDPLVAQLMDELLTPFAYANSHEVQQLTTERDSSLEQVSEAFLSTPFFQFYTDFLALYDAISFSHPLFARLLLPPISMTYAGDYRKLLFGDYGHTIRTIKTSVGDLLCEDLREYLWPVEKDPQILGWYVKALLMSPASEFIRWMAVHHLALNIWPDLRDIEKDLDDRADKLLCAIVRPGSFDVIRDVAFYRQLKDEVSVPPNCYKQTEETWVERRLSFVENMSDQQVRESLYKLYMKM